MRHARHRHSWRWWLLQGVSTFYECKTSTAFRELLVLVDLIVQLISEREPNDFDLERIQHRKCRHLAFQIVWTTCKLTWRKNQHCGNYESRWYASEKLQPYAMSPMHRLRSNLAFLHCEPFGLPTESAENFVQDQLRDVTESCTNTHVQELF